MEKRKACRLAWCGESTHDTSQPIVKHSRRLGAYDRGDTTVTVVARWAERLDGQPSVDPHISIFTDAPGIERTTTDLTPREARVWAGQLDVFDGAPWLAARLHEGADLLADWEVDEFAGVSHRVADRPTTAPESYVFMIRTLAHAARATLEEWERFPIAATDALDLARVIGEQRGYVRYLADALEAIDTAIAAGGLA